jgi:NADH:ubiquinone oxidoreductase subunit B-like Fe-S oxidoreductase
MADGIYNLKARVSDAAGATSVTPANQTLAIDNVALQHSRSRYQDQHRFGNSPTTSSPTIPILIFSGTLSSALAVDERVEASVNGGGTWLAATVAGTHGFTITQQS